MRGNLVHNFQKNVPSEMKCKHVILLVVFRVVFYRYQKLVVSHTHCRLYLIGLWVTVQAVMLVFEQETVGRSVDVLKLFILHFDLQ